MTSTLFLSYWKKPLETTCFHCWWRPENPRGYSNHPTTMTSSNLTQTFYICYPPRSTYHNSLLYTDTTLERYSHVIQNRNRHSQGYPSKGRSYVSRLCSEPGITTLISIWFRRSIMTLRRVTIPQVSPKGYRQCAYLWHIVGWGESRAGWHSDAWIVDQHPSSKTQPKQRTRPLPTSLPPRLSRRGIRCRM